MAHIGCWHCNGNGRVSVPVEGQHCWSSEICDHCGGSGIDEEKTRNSTAILESEKPTYLRKGKQDKR